MQTDVLIYLITEHQNPYLTLQFDQQHIQMKKLNFNKNIYFCNIELDMQKQGFTFNNKDINNNYQLIEEPSIKLNTLINEKGQKIYHLQQKGSYFVYKNQLHLIENNDDYKQIIDINYRKEQIIQFIESLNLHQYLNNNTEFIDNYLENNLKIQELKLVLSLDLDGTLVGDDISQIEFNMIWLKFFKFNNKKYLVYNTARDLNGIQDILAIKHPFIWPQYILSQLGGYVYQTDKNWGYQEDFEWNQMILKNYNHQKIKEMVNELEELKNPMFTIQIPPMNLWFRLNKKNLDQDLIVQQIKDIELLLQKSNIFFKTIISGEVDTLDIDIIPTKCGKGLCLNYLTNNILNLKNDFFTISFGDALTDKDMFYHSNIGVVVKNGQPSLIEWFEQFKQNSDYQQFDNYVLSPNDQIFKLSKYSFAKSINQELINILQYKNYLDNQKFKN